MSSPVIIFPGQTNGVAAGSTPVLAPTFADTYGNPIGINDLTSLTLSITDDGSTPPNAIVNNCNAVDILPTANNRGIVDTNGNFLIVLEIGDTEIQRAADARESRSLTIDFEYLGPDNTPMTGRAQISFTVIAMPGS